jgi:precorrin isomerase
MRPPDKARPRLIIRMPVGFVDAAEFKQALGETAAVLCIAAPGLKGKRTVPPAMVNPM